MACTFDGKTFLGATFQSPVGDKAARVAEILRHAVVAGAARAAELSRIPDDITGEPTPVSAVYGDAESVIRYGEGDWWDVMVKHRPDDAPIVYGDGSTFEAWAHVCPDCSKDLAFATVRAGADTESSVLFEPNWHEKENQYLSRFDDSFIPFRCDVCNGWNC